MKLLKIAPVLCCLIFMTYQASAQPTDQRVKEQSSAITSFSGDSEEEIAKKNKLEKEYLAKARQNIETIRKGDASVLLVDSKGKPLKNMQLEVNQVSLDFLFGNIVFEIAGFAPEEPYKVDKFKERFKSLFNFAVLPFYWKGYEKQAGQPSWEKNQETLDWCLANGITTKGIL